MILNVRERTIEYRHGLKLFRIKLTKIETKILLLLSDNSVHDLENIASFVKVKEKAIIVRISTIREKVEPIRIKTLYKKGYVLQNLIHIDY